MKPYPKYKNSGVEWIGEVPEHWEMEKVSHAFSTIGSGTTPIAGNPEYHNEGTTPWINTGDLNNGILKTCSKKITNIAFNDYSALKIYPIGSLIIAMYGATIGKVSILDFTACTNQACCVLSESKKWNVKYVFYWFIANKEHIVSMSYGGGQPNISQEIIKSLKIPLPERNEQYAIITYLDRKTSQVDNRISKKQKLIELLEEERAAIINQAVTKGLNPDAPMKNSGIEWLGEVPEHWEVKRLKYFFRLITEKNCSLQTKKVALENIESWTGRFIDSEVDYQGEGISFLKGDVLFGKLRPYLAKVLNTKFSGASVGDIFVMRPKLGISSIFAFYRFLSKPFIDIVNGSTFGAKMPRVSWGFIANLQIAMPNNNEQRTISDYLDRKTTKIDQTTSKIEKQIDLLKEFRTALISKAVTGKIDVRDGGSNE